ncbi:HSP70/90 co-chaperone [Oleoguttula sp. CCFEE 5521]
MASITPQQPSDTPDIVDMISKSRLDPKVASADVPPSLANKRQVTADELYKELNRYPLFMTELPAEDEDNEYLEAFKALAYEGTRAEVAENFKTQGNEAVREKRWVDAREFYSKALAALKGPKVPAGASEAELEMKVEEVDEVAEEKRERSLEETCHANRAVCQLEMKNYGSCNRDCAAALKLNSRNVKAWYRAASACLALDKLPEALDACECGLRVEPANTALAIVKSKTEKRTTHVAGIERSRQEREERVRSEESNLKYALKSRNIVSRTTKDPPDMEDATIKLENPVEPTSTLSFPVIFLYPLQAQSDFVKACAETETLGEHLSYILPPPWDQTGEYGVKGTECYMETVAGGLIKAGRKLTLLKLLGSGKVEVLDGLVKVNVVPKAKASIWIEEFKLRSGKQ